MAGGCDGHGGARRDVRFTSRRYARACRLKRSRRVDKLRLSWGRAEDVINPIRGDPINNAAVGRCMSQRRIRHSIQRDAFDGLPETKCPPVAEVPGKVTEIRKTALTGEQSQLRAPEPRGLGVPRELGAAFPCSGGIQNELEPLVRFQSLPKVLRDVFAHVASDGLGCRFDGHQLGSTKAIGLGRFAPECPLRAKISVGRPVDALFGFDEVKARPDVTIEHNQQVEVNASRLHALRDTDKLSIPGRKNVRPDRMETALGFLHGRHMIGKCEGQKAEVFETKLFSQKADIHLQSEGCPRSVWGYRAFTFGADVTILTRKVRAQPAARAGARPLGRNHVGHERRGQESRSDRRAARGCHSRRSSANSL